MGLSLGQASAALLALFTIGAVANAGRATLMRVSGQRIVARLRERTYAAAIRQEVEFVERGEGDVISRLSVDSSIVGERCVCSMLVYIAHIYSVRIASRITSRTVSGRSSWLLSVLEQCSTSRRS